MIGKQEQSDLMQHKTNTYKISNIHGNQRLLTGLFKTCKLRYSTIMLVKCVSFEPLLLLKKRLQTRMMAVFHMHFAEVHVSSPNWMNLVSFIFNGEILEQKNPSNFIVYSSGKMYDRNSF